MSRNYLYEHHRHGMQKSETQDSQPAPEIPRWDLGTGTPKIGTGTQDPSKSFAEFCSQAKKCNKSQNVANLLKNKYRHTFM